MKKFLMSFLSLFFLLAVGNAVSAKPTEELLAEDSMVVQYGNKRIVIYLAEAKDKEKLQAMYDRGALRNLFKYLDATQLADTAIIKDNSGDYRIIKKGNGETIVFFDKVKDTNTNIKVDVSWNNNDRRRDDDNREVKRRYRTNLSHEFGIDVGMNAFIPKEGSLTGTLYELIPARSNYVAFNYNNVFNFSRYARLKMGIEVSWYNFMFTKDVRLSMQPNALELSLDPNGLKKSKLAATYLNIPMLFEVGRRYWGLRVGLGGYVGYRIDSWTKAVTNNGEKQKDRDSYYLNSFRYGITGQVGFRWIKLFANYDLNTLFAKDKAPEINTISVGFRFGD
ncbi:outer membrane beta-barrel protein [Thermoflexibacter ruber]|uniref:Outer membrane protein beta-barrel domain-containing protein n=1 Tax=Thermoflexibacter ruber TaxID=1003 RepID=A0A1I2B8L0_9BACT|nr:outer membrane beta-barrel protein [Thermoflexibacter ruber]SFE52542.1 hypothetical protein SAMN04488541_1002179 [Thermoflexibacter ruber]